MENDEIVDLNGMSFVFTQVRPTDEQLEKLVSRGARMVSAISAKTTHLVCKKPDEDTIKLKKARDFGMVIISMEEFINILN